MRRPRALGTGPIGGASAFRRRREARSWTVIPRRFNRESPAAPQKNIRELRFDLRREPTFDIPVRPVPARVPVTEMAMKGTVIRVSLVLASVVGFTGAASARDASHGKQPRYFRTTQGFKPSYQAHSNVSGSDRPYTWPVNDRYRPVSRPYFGRAY